MEQTKQRVEPPGEFIRSELLNRGWGQADLARILNRPLPTVNEIIQGKRAIMPEMAVALGMAFGNSAEQWMEREAAYRLSLVSCRNDDVELRAKIFAKAPIKEMERRQWLRPSQSVQELQGEFCRFFNLKSVDQEPEIRANARQTFSSRGLSPHQTAWCFRAARLATTLDAKPFKPSVFEAGLKEVRKLADYPEKAKYLTKVLSEIGVRLVVIEPLVGSKIDGAAFWISEDAPVVVLSLRFDRIDCFWFTLFHELSHIRHRDAQSVDSEIFGEQKALPTEDIEVRANTEAAAALISKDALDSFVLRVKPFYAKAKIVQFAIRMQVHPGIVVGQLQNRGEISWGANREMLARVRDVATSTALTDGWGKLAPVI